MSWHGGKGSRRRPEDREKIEVNWPFGDKPLNVWPRDEEGNLIDDENNEDGTNNTSGGSAGKTTP